MDHRARDFLNDCERPHGQEGPVLPGRCDFIYATINDVLSARECLSASAWRVAGWGGIQERHDTHQRKNQDEPGRTNDLVGHGSRTRDHRRRRPRNFHSWNVQGLSGEDIEFPKVDNCPSQLELGHYGATYFRVECDVLKALTINNFEEMDLQGNCPSTQWRILRGVYIGQARW